MHTIYPAFYSVTFIGCLLYASLFIQPTLNVCLLGSPLFSHTEPIFIELPTMYMYIYPTNIYGAPSIYPTYFNSVALIGHLIYPCIDPTSNYWATTVCIYIFSGFYLFYVYCYI